MGSDLFTVMAGKDMGFWCLPEKEDEVLVMFEHATLVVRS